MGLQWGLLQCVFLVLVLAECGVTSLFSYGPPKKCDTRWKYYQTLSGCPGLGGVCRMCDYEKRGKAYGELECRKKHSNDVQLYGKTKTRWCGNTGPIPTCDFPTIANGHTTCHGPLNTYEKQWRKMYPDTVCSFTCDLGFELVGSRSVQCKDVPRQRLTINATLPHCVGNGRSQTTMAGHDYDLAGITTSSVWEKTHNSALAEMAELTTAVTEMAEITTAAAVTEIPGNRPSSTAGDAGKEFPNTDNASNPKLGANETEFTVKFNNLSHVRQDEGSPTSQGFNVGIIVGSVVGTGAAVAIAIAIAIIVYRLKCKAKPVSKSDEECAEKDPLKSDRNSLDSGISSTVSNQKRDSSDTQSDESHHDDKSKGRVDNIVSDQRPFEPCTGQIQLVQTKSLELVQSQNPVCQSKVDVSGPDSGLPHASPQKDLYNIDFIPVEVYDPIDPQLESLTVSMVKAGRHSPVGQSS